MKIKKHAFTECGFHTGHGFRHGCHDCLVQSVIRLCEILDETPQHTNEDVHEAYSSLTEVFSGTHVAHFTEGRITNITALPMSPADLEDGIFRYTIEIRED